MLPSPGLDASALLTLLHHGFDISSLLLQQPVIQPPIVAPRPVTATAYPIVHTTSLPNIEPYVNQNMFCPLPGMGLVGSYQPAVLNINQSPPPEPIFVRRNPTPIRRKKSRDIREEQTPVDISPAAIPSSPHLSGCHEHVFQMGRIPLTNYLPTHFMKGTAVKVTNGKLKNIEDLSSDDFLMAAAGTKDVGLETSAVVEISTSSDMARVSFVVGSSGNEAGIEVQLEYPFFALGKGWSSCDPLKTRQSYGIDSEQLKVGDVCVTLIDSAFKTTVGILEAQRLADVGSRRLDIANDIKREHGRHSAPPLGWEPSERQRTWSQH